MSQQDVIPVYQKIQIYIDDVAKIDRKQVAERIGVSESQFSLLMSGKRRMSIEDYLVICNVLLVKPDRFLQN